MVLPFRLRTAFCALSVCVLSACGGGGDGFDPATATATATAQNDTNAMTIPAPNEVIVLRPDGTVFASSVPPGVYKHVLDDGNIVEMGDMKVGYSLIRTGVLELAVGYLQDDKSKYALQASVPGSLEQYHCISAAWTAAEKAKMDVIPRECGPNISFNPANNELSMVRAPLYGSSPSAVLIFNVQTVVPEVDFTQADEAEEAAT